MLHMTAILTGALILLWNCPSWAETSPMGNERSAPTELSRGSGIDSYRAMPEPSGLTELAQSRSGSIVNRRTADELTRKRRARRIPRPPQALSSVNKPYTLLETDCQWTNDNVADCIVWDCDDEGNCDQYGHYCVDKNANDVPCP